MVAPLSQASLTDLNGVPCASTARVALASRSFLPRKLLLAPGYNSAVHSGLVSGQGQGGCGDCTSVGTRVFARAHARHSIHLRSCRFLHFSVRRFRLQQLLFGPGRVSADASPVAFVDGAFTSARLRNVSAYPADCVDKLLQFVGVFRSLHLY